MKNKMKTRKTVAKRFKVTGNGDLKRGQSSRRHNAHSKTKKQRRQLKKGTFIHPTDEKRIRNLL